MTSKEGYDVLRLIGHNQSCYVSSEYVNGIPLIRWLKYHPVIPKEQLFGWVDEMVKQVAQIHKCNGHPCYQYVNPYSIIVTEDENIYFLDLNAESNEEQIRKMQRRTVREYFLPPEEKYYRKASLELDIYGLGKTIQYMLSETEPEPKLKKREVIRFRKIISKCIQNYSKKTFQKVSDIQKYIPKYQKKKEKRKLPFKRILLVIVVVVIASIVILKRFAEKRESEEQPVEEIESVTSVDEETIGNGEEESRLKMELGLLYFLEIRDYEKSQSYFNGAGDVEAAKELSVIAGMMKGEKIPEEQYRQTLKEAEGKIPESGKRDYYECILRGYICLDSVRDREEIIRIGRKCLELKSGHSSEILGWIAEAYEKNGEYQEAVSFYEKQMLETQEEKVLEGLYKKIAELYENSGQKDQAQKKIKEGIEEFPESAELRIYYIRIQCADNLIDRDVCRQTIETNLIEMPELAEEEEFRKLMKEFGWKTKGAKVWEEK